MDINKIDKTSKVLLVKVIFNKRIGFFKKKTNQVVMMFYFNETSLNNIKNFFKSNSKIYKEEKMWIEDVSIVQEFETADEAFEYYKDNYENEFHSWGIITL